MTHTLTREVEVRSIIVTQGLSQRAHLPVVDKGMDLADNLSVGREHHPDRSQSHVLKVLWHLNPSGPEGSIFLEPSKVAAATKH